MENINSEQKTSDSIKEFHIDDLIKNTYKKIAEWHNDENVSTVSLKYLTIEIIEDIAGQVFNHLGLTYTSALSMDEETRKKLQHEKSKTKESNAKSVDEMTDEELMIEIQKRKLSM